MILDFRGNMSSPKAVRLKNIEIKNFKSFSEASLSFPSDGLVALNARNLDTGGSSGSGKSNLNNAVAFALGFANDPATTLQSWNAEDPMQVVLTLDTSDGEVIIGKGHKNYLKIGKRTVTGAKAIEEELRRIFGVDSSTLKTLVYRPQKSSGLFLSMDDAEKKEFLGRVLDLDRFDSALEDTKEAVSVAKIKHQTAQNALTGVKNLVDQYPVKEEPKLHELVLDDLREQVLANESIAQEKKDRADLVQVKLDKLDVAFNKRVSDLKSEFASKQTVLEEQIAQYWNGYSFTPDVTEINQSKAKLEAIKPRLTKAKELYDASMAEYRSKSQIINKSIAQATVAAKQIPSLKQKLAEAEKHEKSLKEGTCYVCKRGDFYETHTLDTLLKEIASLKSQIEEFSKVADSIQGLEDSLRSMQEPSNDLYNKLLQAQAAEKAKLESLSLALKTQEEQAKKDYASGCEQLQTELKLLKSDHQAAINKTEASYQAAASKLKSEKSQLELESGQALAVASTARSNEVNMLKSYEEGSKLFKSFLMLRKQEEEAASNLHAATHNLDLEQKSLEMLRGFVGSIFEEILNEISEETNKILSTIPNVSHCSIEFRTESTTQKGTVKQKITPMVNVNGHVSSIKTGCSGGMESAIELAVDIAMSNVITRRTGASPQWLVLDEAFDGFDNIVKESCLEMLQKHANDKLVIVVSHISDFKEFFSESIWVEYQNGESRIVNVPTQLPA